jgi:hypothetical protein
MRPYCTNYLIDLKHAVIMDVEATTAVRQAEVTANGSCSTGRKGGSACLGHLHRHEHRHIRPRRQHTLTHLSPPSNRRLSQTSWRAAAGADRTPDSCASATMRNLSAVLQRRRPSRPVMISTTPSSAEITSRWCGCRRDVSKSCRPSSGQVVRRAIDRDGLNACRLSISAAQERTFRFRPIPAFEYRALRRCTKRVGRAAGSVGRLIAPGLIRQSSRRVRRSRGHRPAMWTP